MKYRTFSSLHGFSIDYPSECELRFQPERVEFWSEDSEILWPVLTVSTPQTDSPAVEALAEQVLRTLATVESAEIDAERTIQLAGLEGYRCDFRYVAHLATSDDAMLNRAITLSIPLHDGKVSVLLTFVSSAKEFKSFERQYVSRILDSFQLEEGYGGPDDGYRRIARDAYGVSIDFPENWMITAFDDQRVAFRSTRQSWQIDNETLITSQPDPPHSLRDYCAAARLSFKSEEDVEIVEEYNSKLVGIAAYSIHYTLRDARGVLNDGRQKLAVTSDGLFVNLTTLAPQQKSEEYADIFRAIESSLVIR